MPSRILSLKTVTSRRFAALQFLSKLLLTFLLFGWCPAGANAQFFNRGLLTSVAPVHPQGVAAVISVRGSTPGVFIAYVPDGTVQSFDPNALPDSALSVFLSFSSARNRFEEVISADGKRFGIGGSFAISLGPVTVSLNSQPFSSYLSVVTDTSPSASILGVASGLEVVVNSAGPAVEVLRANSALTAHSGVIIAYSVSSAGGLLLGDTPFTGSQIGITVESSNPCLGESAAIISAADYDRWANTKPSHSLEDLKEKKLSRSSLTILTSTGEFVTALDSQGKPGVIRAKPIGAGNQFDSAPTLCVFNAL
jgi:hypothetical protein